jgi:hypothetical protein
MQSLRDKLLKAGLVTEEQAKQAETDNARKKARPPPQPPQPARARDAGPERNTHSQGPRNFSGRPAAPAVEGRIPKLPPLPGSKAHQREQSKKQLALDRTLRELVHGAQVPPELGSHTFYFVTRKGRLRRLEVSEAQAKLLETGALAVVERPEPAQIEHSLVPPETAEKMLALQEKSVRFFNRTGAPVGFISDDELKERQKAEETAGPEEASGEGEASRADDDGASGADGAEAAQPAEAAQAPVDGDGATAQES